MVAFCMRNAQLFGYIKVVKHGQIWKAYDSFSLKSQRKKVIVHTTLFLQQSRNLLLSNATQLVGYF